MIRVTVDSNKLNAAQRAEDKFKLMEFYRTLNEKLAGIEAQAKIIGCDEVTITISTREPQVLLPGTKKCDQCGAVFDVKQTEERYNEQFSYYIEKGEPSYMEKYGGLRCCSCASSDTKYEIYLAEQFSDVILDELFPNEKGE